jgi:type 1 fimbriae regulatory protein FimB/type 1 fimbriae regulatory protein FimE
LLTTAEAPNPNYKGHRDHMAEAVSSLHDARKRAITAQRHREEQATSCSIFCTITNTHQAQSSGAHEKSPINVAAPTTANRTLRRLPNASYRPREYLTEAEIERLINAARKRGRNSTRDVAAILLAYRHGLRAAELCSLRWSQVDLRHGRLHVNRAKGGIESVHPLHGPELRALRPLQGQSPYVFVTEAGTPVTTAWFLRMVQRTGRAAKLPFPVHPHMLRHSTGYSWPMMARIPGRLLTILGIGVCNRPRGTLR